MAKPPDIITIGAAHWDVIGRSPMALAPGDDVPGPVTRRPGGVALNVAGELRRQGFRPALLSAVGRDAEGEALLAECRALGIATEHVHRPRQGQTDRYVAVEDPGGLIAAVADTRLLEAAGAAILAPLEDGRLGAATAPWAGTVVIDANLSATLMAWIAASPLFARADLRLVAVSPAKAWRLAPFLGHARATICLNLAEAQALTGKGCGSAPEAAAALLAGGLARALVTDGDRPAALAEAGEVFAEAPARVPVTRVTGAGDVLVAAHIAAGRRGESGARALRSALRAAAGHVAEGAA